jgi:hypothetical protein
MVKEMLPLFPDNKISEDSFLIYNSSYFPGTLSKVPEEVNL